jgi:GntR family transcriptional regulator
VLVVNENSKFQVRPLYLQVRDALLERIKDGRWQPGATLPSEIELHRELGVSLGTLRKALSFLESEKLITRQPGRGTFVRDARGRDSARGAARLRAVPGAGRTPERLEVKAARLETKPAAEADRGTFQVRPLYLQVRDAILESIKERRWQPGASLPSEMDLYRELGVSLGTLRKALSVLESEKLIVRHPGRGTFVRDNQAPRTKGRFNPMRAADGSPATGEIKTRKVKLEAPNAWERGALQLAVTDEIVRVHRVRFHGARPFAYELLSLPHRRFPGLAARKEVADELEELAQAWGIVVARAEAKVTVAPPLPGAAAALNLPERVPVLSLEQLVFDTDGVPVEAMTACYHLRDEHLCLEMR